MKAVKILIFGLLALALLAIGCIGAQALWKSIHHRYDQPNSGYYHGSVHAIFSGTDDDVYSFRFEGQTEPRWRWVYTTNLIYRNLKFDWVSYDSEANASEGRGTLNLPSFAYESSGGTGVLTRAVLSQWLLDSTNRTPRAMQSVGAVFGFLEAAGRGTLPAPRHHTYYFETPVRGHIQHFSLGFGVGGFVYIWIGIWSFFVAAIAMRFWKSRRSLPARSRHERPTIGEGQTAR